MKKWAVIIVSLLLIVVSADLSKAGDVDEIQAISDRVLEAWSTGDGDSLADLYHGTMGFGHFSSQVSDHRKKDKEMLKFFYKSWLKSSFDSYKMTLVSRKISIIDNTAITCGFVNLKYKNVGALSQPEEKVLRVTETYVKVDGKWKLILFHRDTGVH